MTPPIIRVGGGSWKQGGKSTEKGSIKKKTGGGVSGKKKQIRILSGQDQVLYDWVSSQVGAKQKKKVRGKSAPSHGILCGKGKKLGEDTKGKGGGTRRGND